MSKIEPLTIDIPKCGKSIIVDFDALPDNAKLFYIMYGIKQSLNDRTNKIVGTFISGKNGERWTKENLFERVQSRADAIAKGIFRTVSLGGLKGKASRFINIDWMKKLNVSKDDIKKSASDTNFVIRCYVSAIATKRELDRQDEDVMLPINDAVRVKYDAAVDRQIAVYEAQKRIQEASEKDSLDLDIDLE